ncbi:MAG: sulfite exporter TauE/SafE family protein [Bacteroidota bacterium]|nr:sulfite exporter TauE/SafE family protein [Bacteroidota bacterium]
MSFIEIIILVFAGVMVGFINVLAGGGSIISLSVLMFMGLPVNLANGTNRIAILLQNVVAVSNFQRKKVLDLKKGKWLLIPAVIGSLFGAQLANNLNEIILERSIAVVLIVILFTMIYKPSKWLKEQEDLLVKKINVWQILIFLFVGFYGGFIQAGVGFFLLTALVFSTGYELVKANALKVFIILCYTPFSLLVFVIHGDVDWLYGVILAIGTMAGAFLASKFAIEKGAKFVRWIVIIVILVTILKLFGIININLFD